MTASFMDVDQRMIQSPVLVTPTAAQQTMARTVTPDSTEKDYYGECSFSCADDDLDQRLLLTTTIRGGPKGCKAIGRSLGTSDRGSPQCEANDGTIYYFGQ